jgi:hypothetical protein
MFKNRLEHNIIFNRVVRPPLRVPRRTIHCSDGVVEEYSTDEEEFEEIR